MERERLRVIGIGEYLVTSDADDVLITYSLGSCVGLTAWDPVARIGGMIHCLLPSQSGASKERTAGRFVDTGVPLLLDEMFAHGATKKDLEIKVAGAASPLDTCNGFRIGERNHAMLRKLLWKNAILIATERVGGTAPRTLLLDIETGCVRIRSGSNEEVI